VRHAPIIDLLVDKVRKLADELRLALVIEQLDPALDYDAHAHLDDALRLFADLVADVVALEQLFEQLLGCRERAIGQEEGIGKVAICICSREARR